MQKVRTLTKIDLDTWLTNNIKSWNLNPVQPQALMAWNSPCACIKEVILQFCLEMTDYESKLASQLTLKIAGKCEPFNTFFKFCQLDLLCQQTERGFRRNDQKNDDTQEKY